MAVTVRVRHRAGADHRSAVVAQGPVWRRRRRWRPARSAA